MNKRFTLKMHDYIHTPDGKRAYNEWMFAEIAPRYDLINKILSFGRDRVWKNLLVQALPNIPNPVCLDLACGTGDITFRLAERYPAGRVTGIDIAAPMLNLANSRNRHVNVAFLNKDMCDTGVEDSSIDIVTGAYALRNAPDLKRALKEIRRVLKPGGIAAFLDFSKPPAPAAQKIESLLLKTWAGLWGLLLHRNHEVYTYIAESLKQFPDSKAFETLLTSMGLHPFESRTRCLGIIQAVLCRKTAAENPLPSA